MPDLDQFVLIYPILAEFADFANFFLILPDFAPFGMILHDSKIVKKNACGMKTWYENQNKKNKTI